MISCLETIFSTAKALTELTSVGIPVTGLERKDEDALAKLQKKDGTREGEVYIRILAIGGAILALFWLMKISPACLLKRNIYRLSFLSWRKIKRNIFKSRLKSIYFFN